MVLPVRGQLWHTLFVVKDHLLYTQNTDGKDDVYSVIYWTCRSFRVYLVTMKQLCAQCTLLA